MIEYLTNWYHDDVEAFVEKMRADLPAVLERYHFRNEFVSITKNFNFDPPWTLLTVPSVSTMKKAIIALCTMQFLTFG